MVRIGVDGSCWANRRGYGRYTRELLHAVLERDRASEYVFFIDAASLRTAAPLPENVRVVSVVTSRAATEAAAAGGRRSLGDMWAMRRAVARESLDLFYFPSVYTFFPIKTRARVAVTIHDTIAERFPDLVFPDARSRLFWKIKVRLAVRRADRILTVSRTAKDDVVLEFGLQESRVSVVSDAVSPMFRPLEGEEAVRDVARRHGIGSGERFILYVGGISPHKNLAGLVDAFAGIAGVFPEVKLLLAGDYADDGFYSSYPATRRQIEALGLEARVTFTGFVTDEELLHLYNAAEVLVLPSFHEGFGLPALEAMACGTPVIVSDAGALPEVVGDAGRIFDPRKADALGRHLHAVLGDPGTRREMSERGLHRAKQLSWGRSAERALSIFEEMLGADRSAA